jgi:hypothetical protein
MIVLNKTKMETESQASAFILFLMAEFQIHSMRNFQEEK